MLYVWAQSEGGIFLEHSKSFLSLLQDIVKDPKFILGGATRTDICQGDLGE